MSSTRSKTSSRILSDRSVTRAARLSIADQKKTTKTAAKLRAQAAR